MNIDSLLKMSEKRLSEVHPTLREKAIELIKLSYAAGVNIIITQGLRTIEYQNELYAQGRTKPGQIVTNAEGGHSFHNFGLAVDFGVLNPDGKTINWDTSVDLDKDKHPDWYEVGAIGEKLGLEWGAHFKSIVDIPHFQLTFGLTTAQLRAGKKPPMPVVAKPVPVKEDKPVVKKELLDKDVADRVNFYLGKLWNVIGNKEAQTEIGQLADKLRVASGQEPKNGG